MKGKAVILLCCFLSYLTEWTAVPQMMEPVQKNCCVKAVGKKSIHHCPNEDKRNEDKRNKGCTDCGVNCPMCYTMIMPVTGLEEAAEGMIKQAYPDFHSADTYGYHPDAWKPPNRA